MNVETLSRPELLTLLSVLEGELEAQDVVIHALRVSDNNALHAIHTKLHTSIPYALMLDTAVRHPTLLLTTSNVLTAGLVCDISEESVCSLCMQYAVNLTGFHDSY